MEILDVVVHLDYAFDVGYEIDLDRAGTLLHGVEGTLPRRKRTPESIRYRPAPLRVSVDVGALDLPGGLATVRPPRGILSLFDFAAVSLALEFPLRVTPGRSQNSPVNSPNLDRSTRPCGNLFTSGSNGSGRPSSALN